MKISESTIIITAAILTSMPRWIIALLAGEGILVPEEWKVVWVVISAFLAAAMAVVEGFAFAYIFKQWRNQTGKASQVILGLSIASAVAFVFTLAPSMAASVRGISMSDFIQNDWVLLFWTTNLALSTILIVISVGYSEKVSNVDPKLQEARTENSQLRKQVAKLEKVVNSSHEWAFMANGTPTKTKIYELTKMFPELSTKDAAILCGTENENYVSQHRYKGD